ncbi:MAG: hypothetical protein DHS20C02_01840 [Micavibrio sp.]|nr:MAG: hypothetical protein DHS20C02_01840 [Micavibrio sp.]
MENTDKTKFTLDNESNVLIFGTKNPAQLLCEHVGEVTPQGHVLRKPHSQVVQGKYYLKNTNSQTNPTKAPVTRIIPTVLPLKDMNLGRGHITTTMNEQIVPPPNTLYRLTERENGKTPQVNYLLFREGLAAQVFPAKDKLDFMRQFRATLETPAPTSFLDLVRNAQPAAEA